MCSGIGLVLCADRSDVLSGRVIEQQQKVMALAFYRMEW